MRASDLVLFIGSTRTVSVRVETKSDALQIIGNDFQLRSYIERFGDVVLEYDEAANVYRVPEFAGVIARYSAAKQIECDRWGCE